MKTGGGRALDPERMLKQSWNRYAAHTRFITTPKQQYTKTANGPGNSVEADLRGTADVSCSPSIRISA